MPISTPLKTRFFQQLRNIFFLSLVLSSCTILKKHQKGKPFVTKNSIEVKGGKFTKDELIALKSRLNAQLDDSSKINVVDKLFFWHFYTNPPAFDTSYASKSAKNMQASMLHLGYYRAQASYKVDTIHAGSQQRIHVQYVVEPGKPTLIDTFSYSLKKPDLQQIAQVNIDKSLVEENKPVTKAAVLGEISRLVDIYRNNGYYKFSSEELKMRGDTTLDVLTNINDDPFEQLRLLAEAQQKKDSPKIKLALVLNPPADSNRLKQYYINNIYILPDYIPLDTLNDPSLTERVTRSHYTIRYHKRLFRTGFLVRKMTLKKGDLYSQNEFYKTLNNFSRAGVWQNTNIEVVEVKEKDSVNKINLVVQLLPAKQYAFETSIEASYSATSNTNSVTAANAGNLLGLSGNVSFTNRNWLKEGIKMTTAVRAGVELNIKPDSSNTRNIINSNELSLSNSILFPRFIFPLKKWNTDKRFIAPETFINTNLSYINRINLFDLQSTNLSIGYSWHTRKGGQVIVKPLNIEFTKLYNQSKTFDTTLMDNPFLRYSFNTALVAGVSTIYSISHVNVKHPNRQHNFKIDFEESGVPLLPIPVPFISVLPIPVPLRSMNVLSKYLRQYAKLDVEYIYSKSRPKSAFIFRVFGGVGLASRQDTTLPFFKQYYGGGSNSMRGWPIRGIGRGSQPLAPYGTNKFNDRTGDIQFEVNPEYRFNIAQIIPNTLVLKGALFIDAGNVWNLRNSKPGGGTDSAQFKFKNFWREMGINAGTGLRLDFNYFVVRLDFGFRFKRPEISYVNDGWKIPALSFSDVLPKIFAKGPNEEYRRWRYENFNFTIGINYPFQF
ncbi:BamA/TamA family outer membrane protein [Ferruginibacter sp. SUN106]|uniref:translocation and assembly module lipoprotein TamL n=1 Tax=Ferruginibacter sp. SUN106 TaxID=2978348 RepID=UPI003D3620C1